MQELIKNPKLSPTQAALKVYGRPDKPTTYGTAQQIAHDNLTKPNIQLILENYGEEAVSTIYQIMKTDYQDSRSPADTRLKAAQDIADRSIGKPTQRIETQSTVVTLGLSLKDVVDTT